MADPYTSVSISGYNANPPPDDGTTVATNKITWAGIKTKLADPLDTALIAVNSNVDAAFAKTISGGTVVSTGVSYPMTAADQGRQIVATASGITITTPDAGTVHAPFMFMVANRSTGTITLAANATGGQLVDGLTSQTMRPGSGCVVQTDGTNWFTSGLSQAQISTFAPPYGFDMPINLSLAASVNLNLLTVALKDQGGNDPTPGSPVLIPFQDTVSGQVNWVSVTSATSINTNAVGATLGTANGVPFRFWIAAFNNAGTVVLALWHSGAGGAAPGITPLYENVVVSTTGISAAATSNGTFYTPNGISLVSKTFRIIGSLEYSSGLATAGTYNIAPTAGTLRLFGPGIKKPGDILQVIPVTTTTTTNNSSTVKTATALAGSIAPVSACNLVKVMALGQALQAEGATAHTAIFQLYRNTGATAIGNMSTILGPNSANIHAGVQCYALDNPATTASTQYGLYVVQSSTTGSAATTTFLDQSDSVGANTGIMTLEEIMG